MSAVPVKFFPQTPHFLSLTISTGVIALPKADVVLMLLCILPYEYDDIRRLQENSVVVYQTTIRILAERKS